MGQLFGLSTGAKGLLWGTNLVLELDEWRFTSDIYRKQRSGTRTLNNQTGAGLVAMGYGTLSELVYVCGKTSVLLGKIGFPVALSRLFACAHLNLCIISIMCYSEEAVLH